MIEQNSPKLECSVRVAPPGVLSLVFDGYYPPGSEGRDIANAIVEYTLDSYNRINPKAILFDFTKLDYVWGDGICGVVMRLMFERHEFPLSFPTCVLAYGRTHKALEPLFEKNVCFGLAGARLFEDFEQAMEYLLGAIRTHGTGG